MSDQVSFSGVVFQVLVPQISRAKNFWCGALFKSVTARKKPLLYAVVLPLSTKEAIKKELISIAVRQKVIYKNDLQKEFIDQVQNYFSEKKYSFPFSLDLSGNTLFAEKVLKAVKNIPYGQTRSYKEIAEKIRHPKAARAVGSVMANNRLPLVVPCHRVVKASGEPGNFSAGFGNKLKKIMLEIEKVSS
jgi:methylated-DNA-[protein]-cysteine S-methyltransferase